LPLTPSFGCQGYAHFTTKTPRQKWLRHIWLAHPPPFSGQENQINMKKKNVRIRIANIGDIEEILVLEKQVYEIHSKARPDRINNFPLIYNYIEGLLHNNNIFLAEENGKIIGFCIINIREIKEHHYFHDLKIIEIDDICIDQKCRKRGIGKLFFEEAIRLAKEVNAKFIELMVWEFNQDAIKFYKKMGMKTKIRRMEYKIEK